MAWLLCRIRGPYRRRRPSDGRPPGKALTEISSCGESEGQPEPSSCGAVKIEAFRRGVPFRRVSAPALPHEVIIKEVEQVVSQRGTGVQSAREKEWV